MKFYDLVFSFYLRLNIPKQRKGNLNQKNY